MCKRSKEIQRKAGFSMIEVIKEVLRQQVLHTNNNTLPTWWDEIVFGSAAP